MTNAKTDMKDFTTGNIFPKMVNFMIPILGALILQAAYGAVDILVVGKFGTTAGISGVSTGSSIINLVTFVISAFSTSVTILIARYIGEKKTDKISRVVGAAICFFIAAAVILSVLLLVFARPIVLLMQAPEEAVDLTVQYIRICGGGLFFIIGYNLLSAVFRGLGDSKSPLLFVGIACVTNIIGDILFIAVFKMNVAGAALATVMAQAVSVILSLILIAKKKMFTLNKKDIGFNEEIRNIVLIGLPIAFQELLTELSFLALCAFINRLGLEASSGYGVAQKIVSFVMLVPSSLMQSMSSFVSQNVGASREDRAKQAMVLGMLFGAGIGAVVFCLVFLFGDKCSALFANDPAVIQRSFEYLKGFAPEAVVTAILFSFIGYYNGHGQTLFVMIQGLSQTFLVRLPVSFFMSIQPDASLTHIGWAAPMATVFGILINLVYFFFFQKRTLKTNN